MNTKLHFLAALRQACIGLTLAASALLPGWASASPVAYHVSLNTAGLGTGLAYLDLQFNPGSVMATAASATISVFSGMLLMPLDALATGNVSGSLPGSVSLDNGSAYNDLFQAITLGGLFAFNVTFSGDFLASVGTIGSTFALSLYGADQVTVLGNADSLTGSLLKFDLMPASAVQGGAVQATLFDASIINLATAVPEPSGLALASLAGLLALGAGCRQRSKSHAQPAMRSAEVVA